MMIVGHVIYTVADSHHFASFYFQVFILVMSMVYACIKDILQNKLKHCYLGLICVFECVHLYSKVEPSPQFFAMPVFVIKRTHYCM